MELPLFSILLPNLMLYLLVMVCNPITATALRSNETDQLALLAFKDGITRDPYGVLSTWNSTLHFCEWSGVTCGRRHQRVTILDLESQGLTGSISPDIGNLSFLRVLNLENNSFSGIIPQEISSLIRLQDLGLGNNSLEGEIPVNISQCSNLMYLRLSYNKLVGKIPSELGSLSKLRTFFISVNNLSGQIPASLGNLTFLYHISLPFNSLEGRIPDIFVRLTNLQYLTLGANKFSGMVPRSLYNLSSIKTLSLAKNGLQGSLPQDIGLTLPNLLQLMIGENQFSGHIPSSLSNASGLYTLSINQNNFTGEIPPSLGNLNALSWLGAGSNNLGGNGVTDDLSFFTSLINCSNLQYLAIPDNHFRGMLPPSIANLSITLTSLLLGRNQIYGSIPAGIENLVNLSQLGMQQNSLTGPVPIGVGKLQRLSEFTLARNKLSGKIPSSLGNLTQLSVFSLASNNLVGNIPLSLQNCRYLQFFDASQNNLDGNIPKQVVSLSSLSIVLNLSHNFFTGSLPVEVGSLRNLGALDVSRNNLSGQIPSALGSCLSLEYLYLRGNSFQGNIPPSFKSLRGLQDLDLSHNNLSGQIPKYLESLPYLKILNISFNHFEGEVPTGGVFRNATAFSIVGNNKLCGGVLDLQLSSCQIQETTTRTRSHSLKIIVIISCVVACLILISSILAFYWLRSSKRDPSSTSSLKNQFLKVSYQELLNVTNGFDSSRLVGIGSFGSVYKGILYEVPVAIKVFNLQVRGASKSFITECNALRKIRHRNLLKVITLCSSVDFQGNDFKAIVYEFMPNGSLEDWLQPLEDDQPKLRNLTLGQRLDIAIDVASGLNYLHYHCQTPIVHCDLKPSNVLLDEDLTAHVGDFGLAKFLSVTSSSSNVEDSSIVGIKGSIGYVAPEYGLGSEVSAEGDVYSFGILLLEMFTRKRPTNGMFRDGLTLHEFSKMALPGQIYKILDPHLFQDEGNDHMNWKLRGDKINECLTAVLEIGVECSAESPGSRMKINDVVRKLHVIKELLTGTETNTNDQNRLQSAYTVSDSANGEF